MQWGNNSNYHNHPCKQCQKERITKVDGKYIRCDSNCKVYEEWKAKHEELKQKRINLIKNADAIKKLEHHRCTTKKRKVGAW